MAAVTIWSDFGAPEKKICHCFYFFPYFPWSDGTRRHDLSFLNVEFKPAFSLSSFTFIKRLFSSSSLPAIPWRREWLPTPIVWPGEFHGLYSPWGCKVLDTTEWISLSLLPWWYHLHIWGYWYFSWKSWFQFVSRLAWHFAWCTLHISSISRVTIYSLGIFLSWFRTSL